MYRLFLIFVLFAVFSTSTDAQLRERIGKEEKVNKITERIADELNLSVEQKEKILAINNEIAMKINTARDNCKGDRGAMREQFRDINKEREIKYKEVLNESQWQQYLTLKEKLKEFKSRRAGQNQFKSGLQSGKGKNR